MPAAEPDDSAAPTRLDRPGRFQRAMRKIWWLHSVWALAFGVGVMLLSRKGLEHADKLLMVCAGAWLLIFVALRFIVGAANVSPDDRLPRRGLRLLTNYVIKQLYQQMFFFLVPLYASSATWSLSSPNWWLVPILLACAIVSTMDLVFDNVIMQRRVLAAGMYGVCVFAMLNLTIPLVFHRQHMDALLIAAAAAPPTVALLSFRMRQVFSTRGLVTMAGCTAGAVILAYIGREAVPPTPMSMARAGIGHGLPGQYECVPGPIKTMRADQMFDLRCVTEVTEPGGIGDPLLHVWRHNGQVIYVAEPSRLPRCEEHILASRVPATSIPKDPAGRWTCTVQTDAGQLVGKLRVEVTPVKGDPPNPPARPR